MKTPFVIMENSAMSNNQRYSILSNEMIRRLSNTNHEDPDMEDVTGIIETFIQQLKSSDYNRKCSREIVICGVIGWKRKIARRLKEGKPFYRSASSTLAQRCKKKLLEKVTWYKKRKRDDDVDVVGPRKRMCGQDEKSRHAMQAEQKKEQVKAVMFVPYTVGSELAKRLREAEAKLQDMTGYRLKIVERAGLKLEDILHKADPWQGQDCKREKCLLCLTKSRTGKNTTQDCSRRILVYETWCMTFHEAFLEAAQLEDGDDEKQLKIL
jgi:hypothetical protein